MASNADDVIHISVSKTSVSVSRAGFGTTLWIGQIDARLQAARFQLYASTQEMIDAGFTADHPAYKWAVVHMSGDNSPSTFALGRRIPGVAENDEVQITLAAAGTWTATINSVAHTYLAAALDTEEDIAEGLAASISLGNEPVSAVQQAPPNDDRFDITNIIGGGTHTLTITPPGGGTYAIVNTPAVAPEVWTTAYAAINTAITEGQWYYLAIEDRDDATILAAASAVTVGEKVAAFQTRDPDMATGTTGNIGLQLAGLSYRRVILFWKASDQHLSDAAMLGVAAAAQLDAAGGQITWNLKPLVGVPTDNLTGAQKANIKSSGGSYYVEIGGSGRTQTQSVEGEFMQVQTTIDWTKARVQEAVFGVLASTPTKVDLDSVGIGTVLSAFKGVLDRGVTNGHYTRDFNPTAVAPASEDIETADKNAGILRNVIGVARLALAIRQVYLRVDLTV